MFVPKSISRLHEIGNFNVKVLREKGDRNTQNMGRLFLTLNKPLWQSKHKKTRPLSFSVEILWKNWCKTFDPWMFGGNKTSYTFKKNLQLKAAGLFKYVWPFVTTRHWRVKSSVFHIASVIPLKYFCTYVFGVFFSDIFKATISRIFLNGRVLKIETTFFVQKYVQHYSIYLDIWCNATEIVLQ